MVRVYSLGLIAGAAMSLGGAAFADQPTSTDEVRATVAEMLSDAETRSSLLAGGDAGHDGKFFIAGDGFRLNIGGLLMFRYVINFRDQQGDGSTGGLDNGDDFNSGFQNRRTQLWFDGKVNKDWDFRIMAEFSDVERVTFDENTNSFSASGNSGAFTLQDAWVRYNFANGSKLMWGQFSFPLLREELVADAKQLCVDRSIVNSAFSGGRSQGVQWSWQQESWRMAVAASDGLNALNTDFINDQNPSSVSGVPFQVGGSEADYGITGRFEFMGSGNWGMFDDFTSAKGQDFGWMFGAAVHWQQSENGPQLGTDIDRDTLVYTADLSFEGDSWNLFGAFVGRYDKLKSFGNDTTFNDFGAVIQGGWRFAENTEIFARWDALFLDSARVPNGSDNNWNFLTVGFNEYFAGHAAKFTADVVYSFNSTNNLTSSTGITTDTGVGFLGNTKDGEFTIRAQFTLVF